ncbi:MAG TPA: alpha/beta hydrolase-fold protein [Vicinamibacterales bacterium]|nr:alpha/beta hydrolase-fold protein [Vicinamibacterales bacterium]
MIRLARTVVTLAALVAMAPGVSTLAAQAQTGARIVEISGNHRNGTATFRIDAPQARDVRVVMEPMNAADAKPMVKDEQGMWTATLGPFAPDYYAVAFLTDGVWRTAGYVHVTGPAPQAWDPRPVKHGTVHQHWYDSKTLNMFRSVWVYTPPGYEESKESFPVLYLLHGSGGDEGSWVNDGLANIILDNQIADGRAKPMIVVMPFGHTNPSPRAGVAPSYTGRDTQAFTQELLSEVIPAVERNYRVSRKADHRAIAGFSMGGNHARLIGLQRLDLFHSVATFSGTIGVRGPQVTAATIEEAYGPAFEEPDSVPNGINVALRLLWLGVGSQEERLLTQHKLFTDLLNERRIKHTFVVEPGGHTWHVWRRNLRDLVALLFR